MWQSVRQFDAQSQVKNRKKKNLFDKNIDIGTKLSRFNFVKD